MDFARDALRDQIFRRQNKDGATEVVLGKTRTLKNAGCGTRPATFATVVTANIVVTDGTSCDKTATNDKPKP